jgi:hypothetical protein
MGVMGLLRGDSPFPALANPTTLEKRGRGGDKLSLMALLKELNMRGSLVWGLGTFVALSWGTQRQESEPSLALLLELLRRGLV